MKRSLTASALGALALGGVVVACMSPPSVEGDLPTEYDPGPASSGAKKDRGDGPAPDPSGTVDPRADPSPTSSGSPKPPPAPSSKPTPVEPDAAPPKGTTCPGGKGMTTGAIDVKYKSLGACTSVLGAPQSNEFMTPDGVGRFNIFEQGAIYWTAKIGAFEVHGAIYDQWMALKFEAGVLGYPLTDETTPPDGVGRYNVFEKGSVYWTAETGAHEVLGRIRDKWKDLGWEAGALGYPTSGEYDVSGGKKSDFQHGSITWHAATDDFTVEMDDP